MRFVGRSRHPNHHGVVKIVSRMGGFGATALLSGLINVATIPIVVGAVGADAWASIAAGQAVGIIGSIIMQLGWGVTGPAEIAAAHDEHERRSIYFESIAFRMLTVPPILAVVSVVAWHIVPSAYSMPSSIAGAGSALLGLTAAWYFVGKGDPVAMMKLDTLPRILSTAIGAGLLILYPNENVFALAILVSSVLPFVMASRVISKGSDSPFKGRVNLPRTREVLREQAPGIIASVVSQGYRYLPLILITLVRPREAAVFALVDRILKFAEAGVKPLSQALQSWVPADGPDRLLARVRTAMFVAIFAGGISFLLFLVGAPFVSDLLGADSIVITNRYYYPAALALGFIVVTQMGMLALLALGYRPLVAWSVSIGGGIALIALWPAVTWLGAVGGLYCLALGEWVVLVIQIAVLIRHQKLSNRLRNNKGTTENIVNRAGM